METGLRLKSEEVVLRLRELYRRYGYLPYKMSKFEEYDLYVRNKSFLVSDNILTFTDIDGKLMALKPDVTLSILKNSRQEAGLQKVYYNENVYRTSPGAQDVYKRQGLTHIKLPRTLRSTSNCAARS